MAGMTGMTGAGTMAEVGLRGLGPIAYLTGEYPKVSHTFIQREVAAMRRIGVDVRTCTIRRADPRDVGPDQRAEAARTFVVLDAAASPWRLLSAHARAIAANPGGWARAARLAWATRPPGARAALWQAFYFAEAAVLARHLRAISARHLHNHFATSSCSVAMLTSTMSGIPYSFTLHGPTELFEPAHWRLDEKIARAALSVFISHFARSQGMLFSDPAHWDRMRIVHCGIDPALYGRATDDARAAWNGAGAKAEAGAENGAPHGTTGDRAAPAALAARNGAASNGTTPPGGRIVFVGRLAAVKGARLLLDALSQVRRAHPDAHLTMVGDGPERPGLEAQAAAMGLADAVAFTGYRDQAGVAAVLAQADMLVLPSFAEGVPVVLMEAMATGLPVIATRVAGVAELVEDGVAGFTVPPGDVATLAARMDELLRDPARRAAMGRAGRARVAAAFDIAAEARWLARLIAGSLAGRLPDGLRPPETGGPDGRPAAGTGGGSLTAESDGDDEDGDGDDHRSREASS